MLEDSSQTEELFSCMSLVFYGSLQCMFSWLDFTVCKNPKEWSIANANDSTQGWKWGRDRSGRSVPETQFLGDCLGPGTGIEIEFGTRDPFHPWFKLSEFSILRFFSDIEKYKCGYKKIQKQGKIISYLSHDRSKFSPWLKIFFFLFAVRLILILLLF